MILDYLKEELAVLHDNIETVINKIKTSQSHTSIQIGSELLETLLLVESKIKSRKLSHEKTMLLLPIMPLLYLQIKKI